MPEITNQLISIERIMPHKRNFRNHPDSQLVQLQASHSRFSQYRSVVLWARPNGSYVTVAGHGILEAMRRNGVREVRADILDVSTPQEEIDAILVADNLLPQGASDESELLAQLLNEQLNAGYDLAALGSDEESLRQMLASLGDEYLGSDGEQESKPAVQFKEYDETIEEGMDTELCQECGKVCLKSGKGKK